MRTVLKIQDGHRIGIAINIGPGAINITLDYRPAKIPIFNLIVFMFKGEEFILCTSSSDDDDSHGWAISSM